MAGVTLNDVVTDWGIDAGYTDGYNQSKAALTDGRTQEQVSSWGGATSWNQGAYNLATNQPQGVLDNLVTEAGDRLITESIIYTNYLVLES